MELTTGDGALLLVTSIATFISGLMLGIYSVRGYLFVSPELADERRHNLYDPVESDESDVDEGDTVLNHAPNWANGLEADARDGLRQRGVTSSGGKKKSKKSKTGTDSSTPPLVDVATAAGNANEECKLVLVVRTDLGMTKGTDFLSLSSPLQPSLPFQPHKHQLTSSSAQAK